jgi:2'-5' RNA ligase
MSVIRAFIAIDLTPEIRKRLAQVEAQLRERLGAAPVRWVPAENIHLTLKFLGDVSVASLTMLQTTLKAEVGGYRPFEISVGGLGAFPSARRPRVIWVGVEAPPDLASVQNGVEMQMERLGYAREERPFSAHLTLGRVPRHATAEDVRQIGAALEATKVGFLGVARVREVHLFKSDLRPSGALYTCLFTAGFNEA